MPLREWWKEDVAKRVKLGQLGPAASDAFTGMGNTNEPAGVVEHGEYVLEEPIVRKLGVENLEKFRDNVRSGKITGQQLAMGTGSNPNQMNPDSTVRSFKCGGYTGKSMKRGGLTSYKNGGATGIDPRHTNPYSEGPAGADKQSPSALPTQISGTRTLAPTINVPQQNIGTIGAIGSGIQDTAQTAPTINVPTGAPGVDSLQQPTIQPTALKPPSQEELARTTGLAGLQQIAAGESPLARQLAEQAQQQIAGQGAAGQAALQQQLAQQGVGGGAAMAALAGQQRDVGAQQAQAAAQTAIDNTKLSVDALRELASQGLTGSIQERIAAGEEFGARYDQYLDALNQVPPDTALAEQIWTELQGQFPQYMTGGVPDFEALARTGQLTELKDINSTLGKLISTDSSFEDVEDLLTRSLESASGKTVEQLAEEQGIEVEELLRNKYDQMKEFGASDIDRLFTLMKGDYSSIVDTPAEEEVLNTWVKDQFYNNTLELDENGNLVTKAGIALMPWDSPETAHVFDASLTTDANQIAKDMGLDINDPAVATKVQENQNLFDTRQAYVDSNPDNMLPYGEWKDQYNNALSSLVEQPGYENWTDEQKDQFVMDFVSGVDAKSRTLTTLNDALALIPEGQDPMEDADVAAQVSAYVNLWNNKPTNQEGFDKLPEVVQEQIRNAAADRRTFATRDLNITNPPVFDNGVASLGISESDYADNYAGKTVQQISQTTGDPILLTISSRGYSGDNEMMELKDLDGKVAGYYVVKEAPVGSGQYETVYMPLSAAISDGFISAGQSLSVNPGGGQ